MNRGLVRVTQPEWESSLDALDAVRFFFEGNHFVPWLRTYDFREDESGVMSTFLIKSGYPEAVVRAEPFWDSKEGCFSLELRRWSGDTLAAVEVVRVLRNLLSGLPIPHESPWDVLLRLLPTEKNEEEEEPENIEEDEKEHVLI